MELCCCSNCTGILFRSSVPVNSSEPILSVGFNGDPEHKWSQTSWSVGRIRLVGFGFYIKIISRPARRGRFSHLTRSRWLVRDNHKSPLPKKSFLFLKPLESAERFRCIFHIKYTHGADRRKKSEGIPADGDGEQFGERWRLGQILGGITPKWWIWSCVNVIKLTEIIV